MNLNDLRVSYRFQGDPSQPPLIIFATDHSEWDTEVINEALKVIKPSKVCDENPEGWDMAEHWNEIKSAHTPQEIHDIEDKNYLKRQAKLCECARQLRPGEVIIAGSAHVLFQPKSSRVKRSYDDKCVELFYQAIQSRNLSFIILQPTRFKEVSLKELQSVETPPKSLLYKLLHYAYPQAR